MLMIMIFISMVKITANQPMYFCMAADTKYFDMLLNLIGSIHYVNFDQVGEIAVFDIGFTPQEREQLNSIDKVKVYDVELVNPDLLTRFSARNGMRNVPGWYAWKPVVIKQALDMFPEVLYMDAGMLVQEKLDGLFEHIRKHGYVMQYSARPINWMVTKYVIKQFNLESPKNAHLMKDSSKGILAGLQGLSRKYYTNYVLPMYECAKNLRLFAEDGSNGNARHDQPLFSIHAYLCKFLILEGTKKVFKNPNDENGNLQSLRDLIRIDGSRKRYRNMLPYLRYKPGSNPID